MDGEKKNTVIIILASLGPTNPIFPWNYRISRGTSISAHTRKNLLRHTQGAKTLTAFDNRCYYILYHRTSQQSNEIISGHPTGCDMSPARTALTVLWLGRAVEELAERSSPRGARRPLSYLCFLLTLSRFSATEEGKHHATKTNSYMQPGFEPSNLRTKM